jgi:hypothetical protein
MITANEGSRHRAFAEMQGERDWPYEEPIERASPFRNREISLSGRRLKVFPELGVGDVVQAPRVHRCDRWRGRFAACAAILGGHDTRARVA